LPDQPFPITADVQDGEIARAERRFLDWKAALFVLCEPVRRCGHFYGNSTAAAEKPCDSGINTNPKQMFTGWRQDTLQSP